MMKHAFFLALLILSASLTMAQEVLMPLQHGQSTERKTAVVCMLPFFDDFSDIAQSQARWDNKGAFFNKGYAPLPPTLGMATLDAFDAQGFLYSTEMGQVYSADTLNSPFIRLDSVQFPNPRPLVISDSVYLSFFYLPGGGYGNKWEGMGDAPQPLDSLVLEFYDANSDSWLWMWSSPGVEADTLFARTGSYWQYCELLIDDSRFFTSSFRFRFRNYCSMDVNNKKGILSNSDQWNIDYVYLNFSRRKGDKTLRDLAFVNPAQSLLSRYQAMPAVQYHPSEMRSNLDVTITNRFGEELTSNYNYVIFDGDGEQMYMYDGGFENAPSYWPGENYQTAAAHSNPVLEYALPYPMPSSSTFRVLHQVKEGVSGDVCPQNDTTSFTQVFENYYAYDDGSPENGYGVTSTNAHVKLACRFEINTEDTLTALYLYFNRTYNNQNADVRFYITVWDDCDGHPGNVIYRDQTRRVPKFEGMNQYVRYILEEPLVCNGTIYVGFEQTTADFINLGFDRNNDASDKIFYLANSAWQSTILRGALMLRPYFGIQSTLDISHVEQDHGSVSVVDRTLVIMQDSASPVSVYDVMGREVFRSSAKRRLTTPLLQPGVYLVRIGNAQVKKVIIL